MPGKLYGLKTNPDAKLLHAIHNILLKEWDPFGIRRMPSMRDEYDDYLPISLN